MPYLSVIIPVYKVEETLDRCLESVLCQNVPDMEVILVDDGSPDGCPVLCDRWTRNDSRVKVLHKSNGGLSDARNKGIDMAQGEYITFVDSDDYLMPDTYPQLMKWLSEHEDCDMLEFPLRHISEREGDGNRQQLIFRDRQYRTARQYWLRAKAWEHCYACNKIYRRALFDGVSFPPGKVFEDIYTLPSLLAKNPRVATTSHGAYCYTWNENGISVAADNTANGLMQHLEALRMAAETMRTTLFSYNGIYLFYSMLCRQQDIYDLTGRIVLPWPLIGLVCRVRAMLHACKTR